MMRANRVRELASMRASGGTFWWRGRWGMGEWLREHGYIQQYPDSSAWRISLAGMAALVVATREYDAKGRLPEVFAHGMAPR